MDRNVLKEILRNESGSSLKPLQYDFYEKVALYIKELEDEIKQINNPRSVEVRMLEDELQSAVTDIEVIFLRRIKKITTRATSTAFSKKSLSQDLDKLLPSEKKIYDVVLSAINDARLELLDPILNPKNGNVIDGGNIVCYTNDLIPLNKEEDKKGSIIEKNFEEKTEYQEEIIVENIAKSNINEEFVVVRILKDLPTFKALNNRNYTLRSEDVVVLPKLNAEGLIKRNVAITITNYDL